MRQTLSQIKEQTRKQIAVKDKLVYLEKASNGQIVDVHLLQWVAEQFLPELIEQARLNKQDYEHAKRLEEDAERELLTNKFILLEATIDELKLEVQELKEELASIRGEE